VKRLIINKKKKPLRATSAPSPPDPSSGD